MDKACARVVFDTDDIEQSLKRIAYETLEHNKGAESLILLGTPTRGAPLAWRPRDALRETGSVEVPAGSLNIMMYRDDLRGNPIRVSHPTSIPDDSIDAATVMLVGDVFYPGWTIRSALEAIAGIGRPAAVQLVVLMDHEYRELPIHTSYVGKNLPMSCTEKVRVNLAPIDETSPVAIEEA